MGKPDRRRDGERLGPAGRAVRQRHGRLEARHHGHRKLPTPDPEGFDGRRVVRRHEQQFLRRLPGCIPVQPWPLVPDRGGPRRFYGHDLRERRRRSDDRERDGRTPVVVGRSHDRCGECIIRDELLHRRDPGCRDLVQRPVGKCSSRDVRVGSEHLVPRPPADERNATVRLVPLWRVVGNDGGRLLGAQPERHLCQRFDARPVRSYQW